MRKFTFSFKSLLVACLLLGGASSAWADGTPIGNINNNWITGGSYSGCSTLSNNQTLTYTFTVDESKNQFDYQGYVLVVQEANVIHDINANTYAFVRSECDYCAKGVWNSGAKCNSNTYGTGSKKDHFVGATVVMTVTRQNTDMVVYTEITKSATTKSHYYYQDLGTTDDVFVFLAADYAKLTLTNTSIEITESMTIGDANEFYTSAATTLAPNSVLNYQFKNTDTGSSTWYTWGIELIFNNGSDHHFDMNSGDLNPWGDLLKDGDDIAAKIHSLSKSSHWPTSDILTKLNGADVTLTVARNGRVVTITAVNTPTSGEPFSFTYTLEPKDAYSGFDTGNIQVKLIARFSRIVNYSSISKVNVEVSKYGWATFSSPYKLDFTGISGLKAYAVTGHDATAITKSDALGVVAANTGVLLKGTEGSVSTYYNIPVSTGSAYDGTNLMVAGTGASVSAEAGKTKYVLGVNGSDKAEFQKIVSTAAAVPTGKAYLQFDEVISVKSLSFIDDGKATGVDAPVVAEAEEDGIYYNLNGQQVTKDYKGIVIVNGKKFFNK